MLMSDTLKYSQLISHISERFMIIWLEWNLLHSHDITTGIVNSSVHFSKVTLTDFIAPLPGEGHGFCLDMNSIFSPGLVQNTTDEALILLFLFALLFQVFYTFDNTFRPGQMS